MIYASKSLKLGFRVLYRIKDYPVDFGFFLSALMDPYHKSCLAGLGLDITSKGYLRVDNGTFAYNGYVVEFFDPIYFDLTSLYDSNTPLEFALNDYKPALSVRFNLPENEFASIKYLRTKVILSPSNEEKEITLDFRDIDNLVSLYNTRNWVKLDREKDVVKLITTQHLNVIEDPTFTYDSNTNTFYFTDENQVDRFVISLDTNSNQLYAGVVSVSDTKFTLSGKPETYKAYISLADNLVTDNLYGLRLIDNRHRNYHTAVFTIADDFYQIKDIKEIYLEADARTLPADNLGFSLSLDGGKHWIVINNVGAPNYIGYCEDNPVFEKPYSLQFINEELLPNLKDFLISWYMSITPRKYAVTIQYDYEAKEIRFYLKDKESLTHEDLILGCILQEQGRYKITYHDWEMPRMIPYAEWKDDNVYTLLETYGIDPFSQLIYYNNIVSVNNALANTLNFDYDVCKVILPKNTQDYILENGFLYGPLIWLRYNGKMKFTIDPPPNAKSVIVDVGAVNGEFDVYLNGQSIPLKYEVPLRTRNIPIEFEIKPRVPQENVDTEFPYLLTSVNVYFNTDQINLRINNINHYKRPVIEFFDIEPKHVVVFDDDLAEFQLPEFPFKISYRVSNPNGLPVRVSLFAEDNLLLYTSDDLEEYNVGVVLPTANLQYFDSNTKTIPLTFEACDNSACTRYSIGLEVIHPKDSPIGYGKILGFDYCWIYDTLVKFNISGYTPIPVDWFDMRVKIVFDTSKDENDPDNYTEFSLKENAFEFKDIGYAYPKAGTTYTAKAELRIYSGKRYKVIDTRYLPVEIP